MIVFFSLLIALTPKLLDTISEQESWITIKALIYHTLYKYENRGAYCGHVYLLVSTVMIKAFYWQQTT